MSDQQQETEADNVGLGAHGGAGAESELVFNVLAPKTQEFGDGGDVSSAAESSLQEGLLMKSEMDDDMSIKSNNSRNRNKSISPAAKGLSKRKRKNRRRREKKAAAATDTEALDGASFTSGGDDGTGTENELSLNEDSKKDEEAGTESENTFHSCSEVEGYQEASSLCVEPSTTITSIPEEDLNDSIPEMSSPQDFKKERIREEGAKSGPTHSVESLLQIAKCKIMSQILEPLQESANTGTEDSSNLVVPPCSPSSLHSMYSSADAGISKALGGTQKPAAKNVHFDEGPPEICSVEANPSELIFELKLDTPKDSRENVGQAATANKKSSKEAIVLIGNVGHTESATSSVASENSAASLLKGTGSSSEDFAEISLHYPSRETVDEPTTLEGSGINADAFRETIQIFKMQNPMEAQYIGNEVDSILTKSLDKFTTIMGQTSGIDDNKTPVFVSGEKLATHENRKVYPDSTSHGRGEKNSNLDHAHEENSQLDTTAADSDVSMNTTFIVEKVADEYEHLAFLRPLSPGEIMPQAIPDTVSDTESVAAAGHLGVVPEEDEDEISSTSNNFDNNTNNASEEESNAVPANLTPGATVSAASCCTVIEKAVTVHSSRPDTPAIVINQKSNEVSDPTISTTCAVSGTESATDDDTKHANTSENLEREKVAFSGASSTSSTKSSVPSPRSPDFNENSLEATASVADSRPSTGTTLDSGETEYEFEVEKEGGTEAKQSVEVFTLHFPATTDAPPSVNNLSSGNGDIPQFGRNNLAELFASVPGSLGNNNRATISSSNERRDGIMTETDSDWPPERKMSLQQVILDREANEDAASIEVYAQSVTAESDNAKKNVGQQQQQPEENAENLEDDDKEDTGCTCGRMCVIV